MNKKGFSLIEVMIAMLILAIALLALAGLMAKATFNNAFGGHMTEAVTFAQDKLEEFRSVSWDNIPEGVNTDQVNGSTGISYSRRWNVVMNGDMKTITITINWNDRISHTISFISVISKKEREVI
ncbi:MAG: prepilin-type N-terminal cleavage/methylation domain-containing protein [Candidatus Nanoarchaeia archaeon]